jgi:hypothetical protein
MKAVKVMKTDGASAIVDYLNREAHGSPGGKGPYSEAALRKEMDGATFDLKNLKEMVKMRKGKKLTKKMKRSKKTKDCGCK